VRPDAASLMRDKRIIIYVLANVAVFALGYYVANIREMGLYLFTLAVGAPASLGIVPLSETIAPRLGWSLGGAPHAWACDLTSAGVNAAIYAAFRRFRQG